MRNFSGKKPEKIEQLIFGSIDLGTLFGRLSILIMLIFGQVLGELIAKPASMAGFNFMD